MTAAKSQLLYSALSKAGRTVIHLDEKPYYGSREASLSLHELIEWAASEPSASYSFPAFDTMSLPAEIAQLSRQCALSLAPSLVPAVGDFIDALVRAGVSRYTGFRLLDAVVVGDREGGKKRVPASKEDVFKDRGLSLPDKRRLMKFLLLAAGDFESNEAIHGASAHLNVSSVASAGRTGHGNEAIEDFLTRQMGLTGDLLKAVMHAVALCSTPRGAFLRQSIRRAPSAQRAQIRLCRRYSGCAATFEQAVATATHPSSLVNMAEPASLRKASVGALLSSSLYFPLVTLPRSVCAVFGGTYVLGRPIDSIDRPGQVYRIKLGDDLCTADQLIASASSASASLIHRAIILIDAPIKLAVPAASTEAEEGEATEKQADSALFVFPPATFDGQEAAIQALMVGESAFACPAGQCALSHCRLGER